ncbi:MAG: zinc metallopeptidase, partial [Methylobacterium mesophilicum]|nr:zinc metallopeptidase [Methylobacterium mesophilicum]
IIIIALVLWFGFGINPLQLLDMLNGGGGGYEQTQNQTTANNGASGPGVQGTPDKTDDFVATVLADTEDVWTKRFQDMGQQYRKPVLVLFDGQVRSACGFAQSATGPFYCPRDSKLYIDTSFFRQLAGQLNSPGDFAQAYVVAHEVGHHVQNLMGTLPKTDAARQQAGNEADANAISVRVELQADCYAGIWAHDEKGADYVEEGDIDEALNAANQIGDDTLQRESRGQVVPDSFTHGTSQQRVSWFRKGFQSGDMKACDTFSGSL